MQAIRKALSPGALSSLEHVHATWSSLSCRGFGLQVLHRCARSFVSDNTVRNPPFKLVNSKPLAQETTQWYSALLQQGEAPPALPGTKVAVLRAPVAGGSDFS